MRTILFSLLLTMCSMNLALGDSLKEHKTVTTDQLHLTEFCITVLVAVGDKPAAEKWLEDLDYMIEAQLITFYAEAIQKGLVDNSITVYEMEAAATECRESLAALQSIES